MFMDVRRSGQPTVSDLIRIRDSAYATDTFIAAVAGLDLFTGLAAEPCDAEALCARHALARRPALVMLDMLEAWGLLCRRDGVYEPTEVAARYLNAASPDHIIHYIASIAGRPSVRELVEVLRTDKPAGWESRPDQPLQDWNRLMQTSAFATGYTEAMDRRGDIFGPPLVSAIATLVDMSGHHRMLDVAGGSGVYTAHLVDSFPGLHATVLERPPVDALARAGLERRGVSDRVDVTAGDMFAAPFPTGYDLHLYSHVLHNWPQEKVLPLLAKSFGALEPGGRIAIYSAHVSDFPDGPAPVPTAEYSVLLAFLYEGRCYGIAETRRMLEQVGFRDTDWAPAEHNRSLIVARKPRA